MRVFAARIAAGISERIAAGVSAAAVAAFSAAVALAPVSARAEKPPFERYQCVLDSHPFGVPPEGFDPNMTPSEAAAGARSDSELTAEQEMLQNSVEFKVVMVDDDGVLHVGFRDVSDPNKPSFYMLAVGESEGGWTVTDANAEFGKESLTVEKNSVSITMRLGEGKTSGNDAATPAPQLSTRPARGGSLLGGRGSAVRGTSAANSAPMSVASRRARRMQEEAALAKAEEERRRNEEEAKARDAETKAREDEERRAQREQLLQIQEELRRSREERQRLEDERRASGGGPGDGEGGGDDGGGEPAEGGEI